MYSPLKQFVAPIYLWLLFSFYKERSMLIPYFQLYRIRVKGRSGNYLFSADRLDRPETGLFRFGLVGKIGADAKKNITFCLYFPKKRYFCHVLKNKPINEPI